MQVLAQNALAEMRALIQQLHPRSDREEGLASRAAPAGCRAPGE
jgi:signal transduction histidine kinase